MLKSTVKRGVLLVVFLIAIFSIVSISSNRASAFGISTPYLDNNTLKVEPGKEYTYEVTIQNGEDQGYNIDIEYSATNDIVRLRNTKQYLPAGSNDNKFYFDIVIPSNAKSGDNFMLEYTIRPKINSTNSTIANTEITRSLRMLVQVVHEKTQQKSAINILEYVGFGILSIVILVLLALIFLRIWKLTMNGVSRKDGRLTNYTISQAMNLEELRTLVSKISDREFDIPEIKDLFREKYMELTGTDLGQYIYEMSRRELIRELELKRK